MTALITQPGLTPHVEIHQAIDNGGQGRTGKSILE